MESEPKRVGLLSIMDIGALNPEQPGRSSGSWLLLRCRVKEFAPIPVLAAAVEKSSEDKTRIGKPSFGGKGKKKVIAVIPRRKDLSRKGGISNSQAETQKI